MSEEINENYFPKTLNTYLGQKGYTILKKELNVEQQHALRKDLVAKPFTQGAPSGANAQAITFPIYRESNNKFYVPRYYGEKYFGPVKDYKIADGDDITLSFAGELRENQVPVVQTFMKHIENNGGRGGGLLELPCAFGKTCFSRVVSSIAFDR